MAHRTQYPTTALPEGDSNMHAFLDKKQIVLLLQGGGALGAYQVGAFEELAKACDLVGNRIRWVAGISIGAINAAMIAAPKCGNPIQELKQFWNEILSPDIPPFDYRAVMQAWFPCAEQPPWIAELWVHYLDWMWMTFNLQGQPHFFSSRVLNPLENPWVLQWFRTLDREEMAFYSTESLMTSLNKHVDWPKLTDLEGTRLSLGATRVCDGEPEYFHSSNAYDRPALHDPLTAVHVRASAALPPAFPPIQVGHEWYFDGGVSDNTPIAVLGEEFLEGDLPPQLLDSQKGLVVFLIDLWDRKDDVLPSTLEDILWRQKSIQYGSRKKSAETFVELYEHRAQQRERAGQAPLPHLDICQIMLEHQDGECLFSFSDADFARGTFDRLYTRGRRDMETMLRQRQNLSERVTDRKGYHPLGGEHAALYRHGSMDKWKRSREKPHDHRVLNRDRYPLLAAINHFWGQFA